MGILSGAKGIVVFYKMKKLLFLTLIFFSFIAKASDKDFLDQLHKIENNAIENINSNLIEKSQKNAQEFLEQAESVKDDATKNQYMGEMPNLLKGTKPLNNGDQNKSS